MDTTKDDRCHYVSPANASATFVARCQMDFYGGDMGLTVTEDLTSCVDECAATEGCMAVSFSTGTCYMKSSIQQNVYSQWVQAAYLLNAH
jgi:acetyl-CoA carboxylase beta subunit